MGYILSFDWNIFVRDQIGQFSHMQPIIVLNSLICCVHPHQSVSFK